MKHPPRYPWNRRAVTAVILLCGLSGPVRARDIEKPVEPEKSESEKAGKSGYWREYLQQRYSESSDVIVVSPFKITSEVLTLSKALVTMECRIVKTLKGKMEFSKPLTIKCYYEPDPGEKSNVEVASATTPFRFVFINAGEDVDKDGVITADGWSLPKYSKDLETFLRKLK